jgi:uncharacterized lipoprotein YddW (UPF0748 family)
MKTILLALTLCAAMAAHAETPPKREMRGVWISTHLSLDWPNRLQTPAQQRTALQAILDHNKATGMNAAFLQVRSQADAMFPSPFEPWSYYLTNQQGQTPSPAWDPLQFAIDEARKRGLEFHAWINPYRAVATVANAGNTAQYTDSHVSRTHPEWMLTVGTVRILNPGLPQVRDHVAAVVLDIVQRYDVDGIHFDDYFYPSGTTGDDAAYNADPRGFPATVEGRADWRRDNVNLLIARVNDGIRAIKPWVKFGVSPSGIYRSSTDPAVGSPTSAGASQHYLSMFADSRKWIQSGWVDYLTPQVYWYIGQAGSDYKLLVPWWNMNAYDRHIYIGLADYKMGTAGWTSPAQIADQIALNRKQSNVSGQIHFRHAFLAANPLNYRTDLKDNIYNKPALRPAMPWKDASVPAAPAAAAASLNADGSVSLSWTAPPDGAGEFGKPRQYAIYRAEQGEIDIGQSANLLGLTLAGETNYVDRSAAPGKFYYYQVTTLNRLHHESAAGGQVSNDSEPPTVVTRNIERTLHDGTVEITTADIDNGSHDNWGIKSLSLDKTSFACAAIGDNAVTLTAVDLAGNTASAPATVKVLGAVPQPSITVSRADTTATGLPANTIAIGYGAQVLTLSAADGAPGSISGYAWSPAEGLSSPAAAVTDFTPVAAGSFTFTANARNQYACMASSSVTITVIDARCQGDRVAVCKRPDGAGKAAEQVCVSGNAVTGLLRAGAMLGACSGAQ